MNDLISVLRKVSLFETLSEKELRSIAALATRERLQPGQVLFWAGDKGDAMYVIETGSVKISRLSPAGKERILRILSAGEVIGEMALFDGKERSASAIALEPSILVRLPKDTFLSLLEATPAMAVRMLAILAGRLRRMNQAVEDGTFLPVRCRVARLLLELAAGAETETGSEAGIGTGANPVTFPLKLTQEDMAGLVGATRESVSRVWREFQDRGILCVEGRTVCIKRMKDLQALVEM